MKEEIKQLQERAMLYWEEKARYTEQNNLTPDSWSIIFEIIKQSYKQGREDMMGEINKIHENMNDWSDAEYRANFRSEISLLTNKQ